MCHGDTNDPLETAVVRTRSVMWLCSSVFCDGTLVQTDPLCNALVRLFAGVADSGCAKLVKQLQQSLEIILMNSGSALLLSKFRYINLDDR